MRTTQKKAFSWKRLLNRCLWSFVILFILMNVFAAFHAYRFTHFDSEVTEKTKSPGSLSFSEKLTALCFGVKNPRPENTLKPTTPYEVIELQSNKKIECWYIPTEHASGTVILFHGYGGEKSSLLDKSSIFRELGFNTLLVDFMGSGGSEGNQTTIGFMEAEQVKTCYDYLKKKGDQHIYLFGTSLGAVAIMKAVNDHKLDPSGIILECPFGSLHRTVCARFDSMGVPSFPMANLIVFWGGVENGFSGFNHNPTTYAAGIKCPTLLMLGAKDEKVSRDEIDEIYGNLKGKKTLCIYTKSGHENYLDKHEKEWENDVSTFLKKNRFN